MGLFLIITSFEIASEKAMRADGLTDIEEEVVSLWFAKAQWIPG